MNDAPDWFARLGTPLDAADRHALDDVLRGIAPTAAEVVVMPGMQFAAVWLDSDSSTQAYDDDEAERERLWAALTESMTEAELLARIAAVVTAAAPDVRAAAARAAARETIVDSTVVDAATAAALLCLHQHTLAQWAGSGGSHAFTRRYAVFSRGRWPLGSQGSRYGIY